MKNCTCIFLLIFYSSISNAQSFFQISDTLSKKRIVTVAASWTGLYTGAVIGVSQAWYKQYDKTSFHFFNDGKEWLQMDKVGHAYTNYFETRFTARALQWSGVPQKKAAIIGVATGLVFQTTLEMFDAYSAKWGFSNYDMLSNAIGAGLFLSQELVWKEQRICLKYSSVPKPNRIYDSSAPSATDEEILRDRSRELYGHSFFEQALKNYNDQTYWLSVNLFSFSKQSKIPAWLNLAVGYSVKNIYGGFENKSFNTFKGQFDFTKYPRTREFFISPDIDFTRIKTNSHLLKTIFEIVNIVKVPAPALMFDSKGDIKAYWIYF